MNMLAEKYAGQEKVLVPVKKKAAGEGTGLCPLRRNTVQVYEADIKRK